MSAENSKKQSARFVVGGDVPRVYEEIEPGKPGNFRPVTVKPEDFAKLETFEAYLRRMSAEAAS